MADATDLKSVLAKARYGFESHHRHPLKRDFTRVNRKKRFVRRFRNFTHQNAQITRLFAKLWQVKFQPPGAPGLTGPGSLGIRPARVIAFLQACALLVCGIADVSPEK